MTPAPDDLSPDLLVRYLKADVAADERLRVESWLAADPTRATELEDLRRLLATRAAGDWDLDQIWSRIEGRIQTMPPEATQPTPFDRAPTRTFAVGARRRWPAPVRAAAAVLVLLSGAGAVALIGRYSGGHTTSAAPPTLIATTRAQRLSVRLADSTLVVLAPESRLEIAPAYGKADRRVWLAGEAVFTVVHDAGRPFAVETNRALARDLGTRFLVRSYVADSATEVVVAEGLVSVRPGRAGDSLVVARGELARVAADGRLGVTRGVALDRYFAWTDGRLVFENTPLRDVLGQVERWYDVEVRLADSELGSRRVTASFQGESADQVLSLVAALLGLEVAQSNHGYTLRVKS